MELKKINELVNELFSGGEVIMADATGVLLSEKAFKERFETYASEHIANTAGLLLTKTYENIEYRTWED